MKVVKSHLVWMKISIRHKKWRPKLSKKKIFWKIKIMKTRPWRCRRRTRREAARRSNYAIFEIYASPTRNYFCPKRILLFEVLPKNRVPKYLPNFHRGYPTPFDPQFPPRKILFFQTFPTKSPFWHGKRAPPCCQILKSKLTTIYIFQNQLLITGHSFFTDNQVSKSRHPPP